MKRTIKILLSILTPVILVISLTVGLVFGLKDNPKQQENNNQQEVTTTKDIPGVYYASAVEDSGAAVASMDSKGGAIYVGNGSTYTMTGGTFKGHSAAYGGAIYVANGGTFRMTGGEIILNESLYGGAIYIEAGGTVELTGGLISGNASNSGAAVYMEDGGTITSSITLEYNYSQLYDKYVAYYVDGELVKYAGLEDDGKFLANAPLDYENCNGYFTDSDLIHGVEDGELGVSAAQSVAVSNFTIHNLYTRTATPDKLTFAYSGDAYNVKQKSKSLTTGVVVIPRQYNGKNVTSIFTSSYTQEAFYDNNNITAVYLPNTLTSIGNYAFYKSSVNAGLTSVTIPDSVTIIEYSAFSYCSGLTEITIPDSVTSIGGSVFYNCPGLTSFVVDSNNTTYASQDGIIYNKVKTEIVLVPNGILGSFTIPNGVTSIGSAAFSGCIGLTSVTIPDSVTGIGDYAFNDCTGLTSITIPDSVTSIGDYAFNDCIGLTSITIPDSVTSIGGRAFAGCIGLTSITIPDSVTSIEVRTFAGCTGLTSINLPNGLESVGELAFLNCTNLGSIDLPSGVTSIASGAFRGCSGLTSITIPGDVTSIGAEAFRDCTELTTVTIDSGTIANDLTASDSQEGLLTNATTVYVKDDISSVGAYITGSFTQTTSDRDGYNKYVKNS